jgi:simple sugar transport system permease protein
MTAERGATGGGMSVDPTTLLLGESAWRQLLVTSIAVLGGLLVGAALIILSGVLQPDGTLDFGLPFVAYRALLDGALLCTRGFEEAGILCAEGSDVLDVRALGNTLNASTPLIMTGLAVAFGFRAGLFNIGAQGQFLLGAFCSTLVGANLFGVPFPLAAAIAVVAGALGGALWGFIPGALKAWRGAHEVVTTIMLNFVAILGLRYLANTPFRDPNATFPRTPDIQPGAALPTPIEGSTMHLGIFIAIAVAVAVWFLLFKTTLGFEIRTVGVNPFAARYAGIRPRLITVLTMTLAGSMAGIGGAAEGLGITKNYPAEYGTSYGFDGIAVALLGRAHPIGVVGAALLFGVMRAGAGSMQRQTGIPIDIITIVQGVILLFVAAEVVIRRLLPAARSRRASAAAAA